MTITMQDCRGCGTDPLSCFNGWLVRESRKCCPQCNHGVSLTDAGQAVVDDVRAGMDLDAAITKHATGVSE